MVIKKLVPVFLLAFIGALSLGLLNQWTDPLIQKNETDYLMRSFKQIGILFDNQLLESKTRLDTKKWKIKLKDVFVYWAYYQDQYQGLFLDGSVLGYGGYIRLLAGMNQKGKIVGVRVITHQETPGLGDKIEVEKSDWILQFNDQNVDSDKWKIKGQGGDFDQITSATITTNALLKALKNMVFLYQVLEKKGR